MIEKVTGPVEGGYYVAAYAYAPPESPSEYVGFFKLFVDEPESPWSSGSILKGRCDAFSATEESALDCAIRLGEKSAANLPPASAFADFRISGLTDLGTA